MPAASDPSDPASRRRAGVAMLVGLLWLTAAGGFVAATARIMLLPDLRAVEIAQAVAALVLQVAAPLAVIIVALELLRRTDRDALDRLAELDARNTAAAATTMAIRDGLIDVDATLTAVGSRLEALRIAATGEGTGLVDSAARLEAAAAALAGAGTTAGGAAQTLLAGLPQAQAKADAVGATLDRTAAETARQLGDIETMLAGVWARNVDARAEVETATAAMAGLLAGIEAASARAGAAITERTAALGVSVDAALDRTTAALDATRDGVHVQTSALLASVDQARIALDQIGGEASRAITKRLERVLGIAEALGQRLGEHDARSRTMADTVERSFGVLDAKLGHAAAMSHTTLDGIATRMTAVRDQVNSVNAPLTETAAAMRDVAAAAERVRGDATQVVATLDAALPAHREGVAALAVGVAEVAAAADRLAAPVAAGEAAAARLAGQIDAAHARLGEIEGQTEGSALAAASQLIEVLSRVREVAATTAGTMRDTLAGVVAEAEAALEAAGSTRAEAAFGEPVRRELAGVEAASARAGAAAQAAADRVAQRLLGLTATVAAVEARIDEVDARYDGRLRDDLAKRSAVLLNSLKENAIDIARPLAIEVGDGDWAAYLKGDRGLFARRAVRLIDGSTARAIARQHKHDPAFAEQATRYIDEFEALLKRVLPDREGQAMAVTLVSSDIGKLYVALAQALERLR